MKCNNCIIGLGVILIIILTVFTVCARKPEEQAPAAETPPVEALPAEPRPAEIAPGEDALTLIPLFRQERKPFAPNSVTGPGKNAIRTSTLFGKWPAIRVYDPDTGLYSLIIIESDKEYIVDTFILGPEDALYGMYPRFAFYDCFISGGSAYYIYSHEANTYLGVSVRQENGSFARDGEGVLISEGLNPMRIFVRVFIPPTDNAPLQLMLGNQGTYKIYELNSSGKFVLKKAELD
ncbi:hypothetical protein [Ereboglobus luteus]|uniref:Uncharacterized protein n=1 Tax=Ereboglobus luteus TaxID=1796921 RepID=A0A2U8E6C5_9BACT|nr:hypothetical protein [Ereboglobus luteus]AWI10114.1 hypothetical protein CKA38_13370 [Ereboglobus luteus]